MKLVAKGAGDRKKFSTDERVARLTLTAVNIKDAFELAALLKIIQDGGVEVIY